MFFKLCQCSLMTRQRTKKNTFIFIYSIFLFLYMIKFSLAYDVSQIIKFQKYHETHTKMLYKAILVFFFFYQDYLFSTRIRSIILQVINTTLCSLFGHDILISILGETTQRQIFWHILKDTPTYTQCVFEQLAMLQQMHVFFLEQTRIKETLGDQK